MNSASNFLQENLHKAAMLLHGGILCILCFFLLGCSPDSYYEQRAKSDLCRDGNAVKLDQMRIRDEFCESRCEGEYLVTVCDNVEAYLEP